MPFTFPHGIGREEGGLGPDARCVSPSLVPLSLSIPEDDPLRLVSQWRANESFRQLPILLLARSIGDEAPKINAGLTGAVRNTAPLGALRTTIEYAVTIIGGLQRGRARLGG